MSLEDGSLEGAFCIEKPWCGVQFHPEGGPGPTDTDFVLQAFADQVLAQGKE
jgi:carbamoylphosphate synthase small subunit